MVIAGSIRDEKYMDVRWVVWVCFSNETALAFLFVFVISISPVPLLSPLISLVWLLERWAEYSFKRGEILV